MKTNKLKELNKAEVKALLHQLGCVERKSYCHEDYMFTSFAMPYPVKAKLDRLQKKYNITRSAFVSLLIDNFKE